MTPAENSEGQGIKMTLPQALDLVKGSWNSRHTEPLGQVFGEILKKASPTPPSATDVKTPAQNKVQLLG